jgi:hypothetical protein
LRNFQIVLLKPISWFKNSTNMKDKEYHRSKPTAETIFFSQLQ